MDETYLGLRSIIETPIMNEAKWAKVPGIPADSFLVDLEDSVPPALKARARMRVVEYLAQPEYFGGRLVVARPNHLSTPWGRDDLIALAEAGVTCLAYPKCESAEELLEVQELLRSHGADPDLFATIETARSVVEMTRIGAVDKVVSLGLGVGDLSADMGVPLYGAAGELNELFATPRSLITITGAAYGLHVCDFVFAPDLRDLAEIRTRFEASRRLGFTMGATFYPPHVAVINDVFSPSSADLESADEVIGLYLQALAHGDPAAALPSGRTILVHDYQKAMKVRKRAAAIAIRTSDSPSQANPCL
ncbi:MAG: citE [Acidimicrobiaceae bacterium]|nr:MAG: citE [Acidimicrobiaceae bacterium]